MGIFRRTAVAPASLSLSERFNTAQAMQGAAHSIFIDAANALSEAESHYRIVAAEAQEEVTRLVNLRNTAHQAADQAKDSAVGILNLTRGNKNE